MISQLRLPPAAFSMLADGRADAETMRLLFVAQQSRDLLLATYALSAVRAHDAPTRAMEVISRAQARNHHAVDALLREGWFGTWTSRCLATLEHGTETGAVFAYLGNIAAAVARRTGLDADVTVVAESGRVHLPTLGTALLSDPLATRGEARVRADGVRISTGRSTVEVLNGTWAAERWLPLRRLRTAHAGLAFTVTLDDLDALRDCYGEPPAARLSPADLARWQARLDHAWRLLAEYADERADELSRSVSTIVPLQRAADAPDLSISSREAPSAIAMSLPEDGPAFAIALAHEQAHARLNGLTSLVRLCDPNATDTYFAPWRWDPRPASGVLHGIYAFLAVAQTWRSFVHAPELRDVAEVELASRRLQLKTVLDAFADSPALTEIGRRFVAALHRQVRELFDVPVGRDAETEAERRLRMAWIAWRLRNVVPDPALIGRLTEAFGRAHTITDAVNPPLPPHDDPTAWTARIFSTAANAPPTGDRPELVAAVCLALSAQTGRPPRVESVALWLMELPVR